MPPDIPEAKFGRWSFWRVRLPKPSPLLLGGDTMSILGRVSWLTIHQDSYEVVMEDSAKELRRHLPVFRHGCGRVLVSGLGLGCVVRGLLAKPQVDHIDVVEIDRWIIHHFGKQFSGDPRVTIHHGDALKLDWPEGARWDVAWHDIHCVKGDSLTLLHARLVSRLYDRCDRQGWWGAGGRIARRVLGDRIIAS